MLLTSTSSWRLWGLAADQLCKQDVFSKTKLRHKSSNVTHDKWIVAKKTTKIIHSTISYTHYILLYPFLYQRSLIIQKCQCHIVTCCTDYKNSLLQVRKTSSDSKSPLIRAIMTAADITVAATVAATFYKMVARTKWLQLDSVYSLCSIERRPTMNV